MSDPISGTGLAGGALTGASIYGLLTGTDYGVRNRRLRPRA